MSFSSLYFVFVFLPAALFLYLLVPVRFRNLVLVGVSLLFYAWGTPKDLLYLLFSAAFHYLFGFEAEHLLDKENFLTLKILTFITAAADLVILGLFKYAVGEMPLGLSFYTFTVLSYLFDILQKRVRPQRDPLKFLLYVSFFPKVISGPIVQYADMEPSLGSRSVTRASLREGLWLFLIGLAKKVLLADQLGGLFTAVTSGTRSTVLGAWLGMIAYSLQLYYDFSGYSDMAIGISAMFGFSFQENFHYPYLSDSVGEFWRRWHISLGRWFRDYVYIPIGGSRVSAWKILRNLLFVWILTGIWHGNTLNFLIWGLYHGIWIIFERFVLKKHVEAIPRQLRIVITCFIAAIGWVFFFSPDLASALSYIGTLFGSGVSGLANTTSLFALRGYLALLVIGIIGATDLPKKLWTRVFYENHFAVNRSVLTFFAVTIQLLLLLSAVSGMISSTYSSFLYFKF